MTDPDTTARNRYFTMIGTRLLGSGKALIMRAASVPPNSGI